jgi:CDP-4-dehydro-6-deoxyglucose reductase
MFKISLKNSKSFTCDKDTTIFNAAKKAGLVLEHSCLAAKCRSCATKVLQGTSVKIIDDGVLTVEDEANGIILSCNSTPTSNMTLDIEDFGAIELEQSRTLPAKIDHILEVTNTVIKVVLRLPPTSNFKFEAGQYVNIIKGSVKRSYSIANSLCSDNKIEFYIKEYKNGEMSNYWFQEAKENDLLRVEGPLGTFFYRENESENIILLATGTGISPVKSIVEKLNSKSEIYKNKKILLIWGGRTKEDIFLHPEFTNLNLIFVPVLSRPDEKWEGEIGYVQDIVLKQKINLAKSQVYACGSVDMITSSKHLFINNGLPEHQFYSDAFVSTN